MSSNKIGIGSVKKIVCPRRLNKWLISELSIGYTERYTANGISSDNKNKKENNSSHVNSLHNTMQTDEIIK